LLWSVFQPRLGVGPAQAASGRTRGPARRGRQKRCGRLRCRPQGGPGGYLLQVRHRGEVELEGSDEGGVAPLRGIAGGRDNSIRITGQDVALELRQVRVVVAQIQGEYLPGEGETDVPGRVVGQVDRRIEHERDQIGGAEPVVAELSRNVPADFVNEP